MQTGHSLHVHSPDNNGSKSLNESMPSLTDCHKQAPRILRVSVINSKSKTTKVDHAENKNIGNDTSMELERSPYNSNAGLQDTDIGVIPPRDEDTVCTQHAGTIEDGSMVCLCHCPGLIFLSFVLE